MDMLNREDFERVMTEMNAEPYAGSICLESVADACNTLLHSCWWRWNKHNEGNKHDYHQHILLLSFDLYHRGVTGDDMLEKSYLNPGDEYWHLYIAIAIYCWQITKAKSKLRQWQLIAKAALHYGTLMSASAKVEFVTQVVTENQKLKSRELGFIGASIRHEKLKPLKDFAQNEARKSPDLDAKKIARTLMLRLPKPLLNLCVDPERVMHEAILADRKNTSSPPDVTGTG